MSFQGGQGVVWWASGNSWLLWVWTFAGFLSSRLLYSSIESVESREKTKEFLSKATQRNFASKNIICFQLVETLKINIKCYHITSVSKLIHLTILDFTAVFQILT